MTWPYFTQLYIMCRTDDSALCASIAILSIGLKLTDKLCCLSNSICLTNKTWTH